MLPTATVRIIDGMGAWSEFIGWLRGKPKEEDRRAESRLPIHDQGRLSWTPESAAEQSAEVNLIDVSSVGFKARCPEEVPIGVSARLVDGSGRTAEAEIVYCEKDDDAYIVGARAAWRTPGTEAESESSPSESAQPAA